MINTNDILKMARQITKRSQGYHERKILEPNREWLIGVGLFVLIAVGGGIHNALSHVYFDTIDSTVIPTNITIREYNERDANLAIETYQAKQARFLELAGATPIAPVPSLEVLEADNASSTIADIDLSTSTVDEGELELSF